MTVPIETASGVARADDRAGSAPAGRRASRWNGSTDSGARRLLGAATCAASTATNELGVGRARSGLRGESSACRRRPDSARQTRSIVACSSPRSPKHSRRSIGDHGLYAVFVLMLVDAVLPAASELVMVYGGRARGGRVRGPGRRPLRRTRSTRLLGLSSRRRSPGRSATPSARSIGWAIGVYGGRPLLERHGRWFHLGAGEARARRALVRALGRLGRLPRPRHARRPLVRLDPGRRRPHAARPLHGADAARLGDLVLRASPASAGRSGELGEVPPGLPLRRLRASPCCSSWPRSPGMSAAEGRLDWLAVPQIPLVDVRAQYAPLLRRAEGAARRGARLRAVHPRPERPRLRGGGGRVPRRAARDRRRERHGRARARARRARDRRRATR